MNMRPRFVLIILCCILCCFSPLSSYASVNTASSTQAALLSDRETASNGLDPDNAMMLGTLAGLGAGLMAAPLRDQWWWIPAGAAAGVLAGLALAVYAADDYAFPSLCDGHGQCTRIRLFDTENHTVQSLMTAGATVVDLGSNTVVIIPSQYLFVPGSADLTLSEPNLLNLTAKLAEERHPDQIIIMGHTADIGSPAMQLKLTRAQATTVGRYFARFFGLRKTPIFIAGLGNTKPIANEYTVAGRAKNNAIIISMGNGEGLEYYRRFVLSKE